MNWNKLFGPLPWLRIDDRDVEQVIHKANQNAQF